MNWQETLEAIKPLVSARGYQKAKIFVMSRKTTTERGLIFSREVETRFKLEPTISGEGVVIRNANLSLDFVIIF